MEDEYKAKHSDSLRRLERTYLKDKAGLIARMRSAGRSLEEAEDFVHDLYAETMRHLPVINEIRNLSAWMYKLYRRRSIDEWRKRQHRKAVGETDIAEDLLHEIISETGLNPLDGFVRESLLEALNDAIKALPVKQRRVIEAQVFGGLSFRELADRTGENIDTLKARKRYAVKSLSRALVNWIDE